MDGWMDGWTDGPMDQIDGPKNGWTDRQEIVGRMDSLTHSF